MYGFVPGVITVALRFPDGASFLLHFTRRVAQLSRGSRAGSRVTHRFPPGTTLRSFFDAVAALGPLELTAVFSVATGFPRRVLAKPAAGSLETLESSGFEASASAMVVPE